MKKSESEWLDLKAKLLYESGMTLREMRKFFGGVSWQGIQQRLKKAGHVRMRNKGSRKGQNAIYPHWQRLLAQRVRNMGLTLSETSYLLSLSVATLSRCTSPMDKIGQRRKRSIMDSGLKVNLVHSAWIEARNNILLHARANGATYEEIAELAGFNKPEVALTALRRHRKGKRVSQ